MIIYIGADHGDSILKRRSKAALKNDGYEVIDLGAARSMPDDDYPDFARAVAEKVSAGTAASEVRGIVICGSGFGVDIVANKFQGVRSALAMSPDHIRRRRQDDDVNVLALAADFIKPERRAKNHESISFDAFRERGALPSPQRGDQRNRRAAELNKKMKVIPVINCPDVECVQKKIAIAKTFLAGWRSFAPRRDGRFICDA